MLKLMLENVRRNRPLIHNITNYVTANDCANILLACGGSPIMAEDIDEVEEITAACGGLHINIGTLNQRTIPAMIAAGKKANLLRHPVLLDPVGAGASVFRTNTARRLMSDIRLQVIRGNLSEIRTLASGSGTPKGVDADDTDCIPENYLEQACSFAKSFSTEAEAIIVITGAIDVVADSKKAYCILNGHPMMRSVTGTGCQLSALITAFITANQHHMLEAAAAAVCTMGVCGEIAYQRLGHGDGNATYRNYVIDAVYNIDGETLEHYAKYKVY